MLAYETAYVPRTFSYHASIRMFFIIISGFQPPKMEGWTCVAGQTHGQYRDGPQYTEVAGGHISDPLPVRTAYVFTLDGVVVGTGGLMHKVRNRLKTL